MARRYPRQVLLAELEIWHSRPIAPTRRVALGRAQLPVDPAPGFGGILLGGIVAAHIGELDPDLTGELSRLLDDLEAGRRIAQPRLRHRARPALPPPPPPPPVPGRPHRPRPQPPPPARPGGRPRLCLRRPRGGRL